MGCKVEFVHIPVLPQETIDGLNLTHNKLIVDGTVGGGGHSNLILSHNPNTKVIAFDRDIEALNSAKERLKSFGERVTFVHNNFKSVIEYLEDNQIKIDGILLDLGVSSYQLDNEERGFSFRFDSALDMRMDKDQEKSAYDVVNLYSEQKLVDIFFTYGEEKFSRNIAKNIVKNRPVKTTGELKKIIEESVFSKSPKEKQASVQRIFQAIRIEVNAELDGLGEMIEQLPNFMNNGARIAIISFHSLEDRIVKNAFAKMAKDCLCPPELPKCVCGHKKSGKIITKKPIIASAEEQKNNLRSTCAKLRVFEIIK